MKEKCCFACVSVYIIRIQAWYPINLSQLGATCLTELMIREFFYRCRWPPFRILCIQRRKKLRLWSCWDMVGSPVDQFFSFHASDQRMKRSDHLSRVSSYRKVGTRWRKHLIYATHSGVYLKNHWPGDEWADLGYAHQKVIAYLNSRYCTLKS